MWLTRAMSPANLAVTAQWIRSSAPSGPYRRVLPGGGGVPTAYPRFHAVMAEEAEQTVLHALIGDILPLSPPVCSLGSTTASTSSTSAVAADGRSC
jgi:hypothetical protein